jgi:hypothetical protein
MRKTECRLSLEMLEDRFVPASVQLNGGSLIISNPVIRNGATSITVNQIGAATFQVLDGTAKVGTYSTSGSITIRGTNAADSITFNTSTFTDAGSLLIDTGNGNDSVNVTGTGGTISGNITILSGVGASSFSLNNNSAGALTVAGTTTIQHRQGGQATARFGNGTAASTFRGNVNLTGVNLIRVGPAGGGALQPDVFAGDFNASVGQGQLIDFRQGGATSITIGGSLRITGDSGNPGVLLGAATIGKDLVVTLPGAATSRNDLSISDATTGVTTVLGSVYFTGGNGANTIDLSGGSIQGNVVANLGNGSDGIALDNGTGPTTVGGNVVINKGNGNLDTAPFGNGIQATINGGVLMNLGNGNNTVNFDTGGTVGNGIQLRTGNGNNELDFLGAQAYLANATFGNGNNTLTLNNPGAVLSGTFVAGAGTNQFQQLNGTIGPFFQLVNFDG